MRRVADHVAFGHMHEDHRAETGAVRELPRPRALVVASGGDLALRLLARGVAVDAVDTNPAQVRLVRLKVAVAARVGAERTAEWMTGDARGSIDVLRGEDREWWKRRVATLRHGLCFAGRVDRALARFGPIVRWAFDGPRAGDGGALRRAARRGGTRLLPFLGRALHGATAGARTDADAVTRMVRRFEHALAGDSSDDPLVQCLLGRRFGPRVPDVWTAQGIAAWSENATALTLDVASLEAALARQPPVSLGLVSVSNVPDLGGHDSLRDLVDRAADALAPGGRLFVRSMLSAHTDLAPAAFDPLPVPPDASPLCPLVWLGRRR